MPFLFQYPWIGIMVLFRKSLKFISFFVLRFFVSSIGTMRLPWSTRGRRYFSLTPCLWVYEFSIQYIISILQTGLILFDSSFLVRSRIWLFFSNGSQLKDLFFLFKVKVVKLSLFDLYFLSYHFFFFFISRWGLFLWF